MKKTTPKEARKDAGAGLQGPEPGRSVTPPEIRFTRRHNKWAGDRFMILIDYGAVGNIPGRPKASSAPCRARVCEDRGVYREEPQVPVSCARPGGRMRATGERNSEPRTRAVRLQLEPKIGMAWCFTARMAFPQGGGHRRRSLPSGVRGRKLPNLGVSARYVAAGFGRKSAQGGVSGARSEDGVLGVNRFP